MVDVLVFGEHAGGSISPITAEIIAAGRRISDEVTLALFGHDLGNLPSQGTLLGANNVYAVQHPLLTPNCPDMQVAALEQLCLQVRPSVLLLGKTELGRDVGPRVAFRLGVEAAQDSVAVQRDLETGRVVATRPVYGGNAMARVTFSDEDPQVVIVRPKTFIPMNPSRAGDIKFVEVDLDKSANKVRHIETVHKDREGIRLADASVVVSGGRGLGGPEPFLMLEELAKLLGGAMGASRAACDAGWLNHSYQVGLTGATISPDLYITVGISGASQHMAGCSGTKHIVAINKDAEANIFKEASFGVVGNWDKILPSFMEAVRDLKS